MNRNSLGKIKLVGNMSIKVPGNSSDTEKSPFRKMITSKLRGSVK